jgi:histidyl-tRNA synthetase
MRARLRDAGRSGARYAVILGDDEIQQERATVKNLAGGDQIDVPFSDLKTYLIPTVRHSDIEQEAAE